MLKKIEYRKNVRKKRKNISRNDRVFEQSNDFFIFVAFIVFSKLKNVFCETFVFMHFDFAKFITIKINVFDKTFEIIFCQFDNENH